MRPVGERADRADSPASPTSALYGVCMPPKHLADVIDALESLNHPPSSDLSRAVALLRVNPSDPWLLRYDSRYAEAVDQAAAAAVHTRAGRDKLARWHLSRSIAALGRDVDA